MTSIPRLIYHNPCAIPYPTNISDTLLTIRFSTPIRISSIRITPEGVACLTGPGLFLNVSPSNPVNALASTEIEVVGAEHDLDYPVDMPEGVTTRLLALQSPAERLTLSIYGFSNADNTLIPLSDTSSVHRVEKEDWHWLSSWSGGTAALLDLLSDDSSRSIQNSALDALELLVDIEPILPEILDHPTALPFLLSLPSYPAQPLLHRLYADPSYALHRNLRHHLPHSHPLKRIVIGGRKEAWANMHLGRGALIVLAESQVVDLLDIPKGKERSNLAALLEYAQSWADREDEGSRKCLELALDILDTPAAYDDHIAASHLARHLPRLATISRIHGSDRLLKVPLIYARTVMKALLEQSTAMIDGRSCWEAAWTLAQPYLSYLDPDDSLRRALEAHSKVPATSLQLPNTVDGRRLSRFAHAIETSFSISPTPPALSSVIHQATPAELLSLIAPNLLHTLSTAPIPPLGISSVLNPTPESQASAWAGKVYSSHEFRDRERDREKENVGLGIAAGVTRGLGVPGGGASMAGAARPASRHVDEYA